MARFSTRIFLVVAFVCSLGALSACDNRNMNRNNPTPAPNLNLGADDTASDMTGGGPNSGVGQSPRGQPGAGPGTGGNAGTGAGAGE